MFFFSVVVILLFEEIARVKTSLGMVRVSSPGLTALEAGREGTNGCLALICPEGVNEVVVLVVVRRAATLPRVADLSPLEVHETSTSISYSTAAGEDSDKLSCSCHIE